MCALSSADVEVGERPDAEAPAQGSHLSAATRRLVVHASSSWTASFILHASAIVLLGLIAFPVGRAIGELHWLAATTSPPAIATVAPDPVTIEAPAVDLVEEPSLKPLTVTPTGELPAMAAQLADEPRTSTRSPDEVLPASAQLARRVPERRQLSTPQPAAVEEKQAEQRPAAPVGQPPAAEVQAQLRALYDQVVDQFILYDIGELRGVAGMQARAAFHALGPDAIPSLISGFNRSASIPASCPVVVLRSKLRGLLAATMDPAAIELAIAELGQGVPAGAPHAAIVNGLRKELEDFRNSSLAAEAAGLVRQLAREDRKAVAKAMADPNAKVRWAATRVAAERGLRLIDELLVLLDDPHPDVQQEARGALVRLARGKDFGPQPQAPQAEHDTAVAQWRDWAARFKPEAHDEEDDHLPPDAAAANEKRASAYLRIAERLEDRGLAKKAQERYRALIEDFPQTAAADEARRRLDEPGG